MTVSKTIGSGGADYATPALWFAFLAGVGTLGDDYIGNVQNEEIAITANQVLSGVTPAGHFCRLTAGAGNSFVDNANKLTNPLRYDGTTGAALKMSSGTTALLTCNSDQGFQLTRLQLCDNVGFIEVISVVGVIDQCIIASFAGPNTAVANVVGGSIANSLVYTQSPGASVGMFIKGNASATDVTVACTAAGGINGAATSYSAGSVVKNLLSIGFSSAFGGTTCSASSSNNATDAGTFDGTNWGGSGQVSVVGATEFTSFTLGSEDFRVKVATAVKLPANGTASGTPSTDIVGTTRASPPTIGAWDLGSGGGGGGSTRNFGTIFGG